MGNKSNSKGGKAGGKSAVANLDAPLVPAFDVLIEGRALTAEAKAHVTEVSVDESVEWPSMFTLEIRSSDDLEDENEWVDDAALFAVGKAVEVKMGYGDKLESLFKGEITGLEPEFRSDQLPTMLVRGYDRRHRLQRGRQTRTFVQQTDSQIASKVASEAGLTAQVVDSSVVHDYVVQANQTDLEFLQQRALRISYEVLADDKKILFRPVSNDKGEVLTMSTDDHLLEFHPRLSSQQQVGEVRVRGWSPKDKKEIVGQGQAADVKAEMGGKTTGPKLAKSAFGASVGLLSEYPVMTQAEADQMAKAQLNDIALTLVDGDGVCFGRTDLRAGKVIKVDGVGKRFGGQYYVTDAVHTFSQSDGYRTRFTVRRNAS